MARENRLESKAGHGATKILEFHYFFKNGTPKNQALVAFVFLQLFDPTHPEGPRGTPVPRGVIIKSQNWGIFTEGNPLKSNSKNILLYSTF